MDFDEDEQSLIMDSSASSRANLLIGLGVFSGLLMASFLLLRLNTQVHSKIHNALLRHFGIQKHGATVLTILSLAISLVLAPLALLVLVLMTAFRKLLCFILRRKYGTNFGGLFNGPDTIFAIYDKSKFVVTCLLLVEQDKNSTEDFYELIKKRFYDKFFAVPEKFPKLTGLWLKYIDHYFLLKNQLRVEDVVTKIQIKPGVKFTKNALQTVLAEYSDRKLPRNHAALWEILVGTEPIETDDKRNKYPLVWRMNHGLADGISIVQLLKYYMTEDSLQKVSPENKLNFETNWEKIKSTYNTYFFLFFMTVFYFVQSLCNWQKHVLHSPKLTGRKIYEWYLEDNPEFVATVKDIRRRIPVTRFTDVIKAAVSASFNEYFLKHTTSIPNYIVAIETLTNHKLPLCSNIVLENNFTFGLAALPIVRKFKTKEDVPFMVELLKRIKEDSTLMHASADAEINNVILKYVRLPVFFLKALVEILPATFYLTNIPGINKLSLPNGLSAEEVVVFVPLRANTGLSICFHTYDDRLQLGISADENIISDTNELHKILNNIIKYLNQLKTEILCTEKNYYTAIK